MKQEAMSQPENQPNEVLKLFTRESQRAEQNRGNANAATPHLNALSLEDYQNACREIIGDQEVLSDEVLKRNIDYMMQDAKLKLNLPKGFKVIVAVLPFSNYGTPMSTEEIKRGDHIKTIIIDPAGRAVSGFSSSASYIHNLLPQSIQETAFEVNYETEDPYSITDTDRQGLANQYTQAYGKLRELFTPLN